MTSHSDPTLLPGSVLVTGTSGFIGQRLVRRLRDEGVVVIGEEDTVPGGFLDVTDIHQIHDVVLRHRPQSIVHLGGVSGPMVARHNPHSIVEVNITGTANLIEAARIHGISRFAFASSNTVYGDNPDILEEITTPTHPTNVYGATKVACEQLLSAYSRRHGMHTCSLRISAVYGPGRTTHCVIARMLHDHIAHLPTQLSYGADFHREYIYIDDAVDAIILALQSGDDAAGGSFNVSGGQWLTLSEVAEAITSVFPDANIALEPGPDPDDDDVQGPFSLQRARDVLGFFPKTSLTEGIRLYHESLRNQ